MEYLDKIKKINTLAKSLKDSGVVSSMDDAVKMAEKMIDEESIHALSEQSKKADEPVIKDITEKGLSKDDFKEFEEHATDNISAKEEDNEEPLPLTDEMMKELEQPLADVSAKEEVLSEPILEEKKGFFEKIRERFSKKEKIDSEDVDKELEKPKGFFEKIKERFKKKDDDGFEEVKPEL